MDAMAVGLGGAREIVKQSFVNVFQGLNRSAEAAFQLYRMRAASKDRYADYIERTVGVFPLFGTTKHASVDSAYVRVSVSAELEREKYRSHAQIADVLHRQRQGFDADDSRRGTAKTLYEVTNASSMGIALLGNPGSGKTTAMRHLALTLAKGVAVRGRRVIPIFLSVRDMAIEDRGIEQSTIDLLAAMDIGEATAVFWSLLKSEDVAILVDGIDEADSTLQLRLLNELRHLRDAYPRVIVCISGRPYTLNIGLPGFQKWETLPLSISERFELARKWFEAVDPVKGRKFVAECANNAGLLDLGSSPLLLSIVCALYYNDLKVPSEPDELYARTVEGLLGAWDAFRSIARQTPLRDYSVRRRVVLVSWLAAMMFESERVVFSLKDVETSRVLVNYGEAMHAAPLSADDVLRSLYNDFGILIERAPGLYSFSHLTLQEYLTAQYIVDNRRELELLKHTTDGRWFEVIRLVGKMLPNANIFMSKLTEACDLRDYDSVVLLEAVWAMRPICDRHQTIVCMRTLVERAYRALKNVPATYTIEADKMTVRLKSGDAGSWPRILKNLPAIFAIARASGISFHDLRMPEASPFDQLLLNRHVKNVVLE